MKHILVFLRFLLLLPNLIHFLLLTKIILLRLIQYCLHLYVYKLEFVLLFLIKRTAISNTLIVLLRVLAYHDRFFHFHSEMLFDKIYGRQNGQVGIALTTTRPADIANFTQ